VLTVERHWLGRHFGANVRQNSYHFGAASLCSPRWDNALVQLQARYHQIFRSPRCAELMSTMGPGSMKRRIFVSGKILLLYVLIVC
jgi:hypothetical protein